MKYYLPLVLFDPECPLCLRFKQGLEFMDKSLCFVSAREDYIYVEFPELSRQECLEKVHLITDELKILKGPEVVDTIPHIICGGFTKEETEYALIDLNFLGIDNILALRGDCIKGQKTFEPTPGGHKYADELVGQINQMNKGIYLSDELQNPTPTKFCIGVAGYPEKHYEAPNIKTDLKYLKQKIENGADYVVTQMFFDNKKYFDYVDKCRQEGINIPIIPGLKPITSRSQITNLPRNFFLDMPDDLIDAIERCRTDDDVKNVGVEWTLHQAKELMDKKVPCLHFYSMGKSTAIQQIASKLF